MIRVFDILSEEIDIEFVEFFHNTIAEIGKDSYDCYARNSGNDFLLIHFLSTSSRYFLELFHHKDLLDSYLLHLVR